MTGSGDQDEAMDTRTAVFVVRIWREPEDGDPGDKRWRGSVEHLATREKGYAETDEALIALIRRWRDEQLFGTPRGPSAAPRGGEGERDD